MFPNPTSTEFICANPHCEALSESSEILQTASGRVCLSCFQLEQDRAAANRAKFGYKFKKFIKKYLYIKI